MNKQSEISEAVDKSLDVTCVLFSINDRLITQEEIDRADDIRREKVRDSTRNYLNKIRVLALSNEKIKRLLDELEADFERNNQEEDLLEFIDDTARGMHIRSSEKIILESRELSKTLENIHLRNSQKNKKSCDGNHNS